ncbi:hypothetical protein INT43_000248 [Umbelopsis isabellina]|uniref:Uncharacterized protein n=1 Tax=Mortierella isabellina TaxID=91625 RepID=A0A8H7UAL0_MORIS|nr:hypothetical protein INT43_000248 [Umbelopsis isabellina]
MVAIRYMVTLSAITPTDHTRSNSATLSSSRSRSIDFASPAKSSLTGEAYSLEHKLRRLELTGTEPMAADIREAQFSSAVRQNSIQDAYIK